MYHIPAAIESLLLKRPNVSVQINPLIQINSEKSDQVVCLHTFSALNELKQLFFWPDQFLHDH